MTEDVASNGDSSFVNHCESNSLLQDNSKEDFPYEKIHFKER